VRDGRWLNRDPIAEGGGINIYEFSNNESLNHVDNKGLDVMYDIQYIGGVTEAEFRRLYIELSLRIPDKDATGASRTFFGGHAKTTYCKHENIYNCAKVVVGRDTYFEGIAFWIGDPLDQDVTPNHELQHINNGLNRADEFDKILHAKADGRCVKTRCAYRTVDFIYATLESLRAALDLDDARYDYESYGDYYPPALIVYGKMYQKLVAAEEKKAKEENRMNDACGS